MQISPALYGNLSFNFIRDISPVAAIMRVPNVMEVTPSLPVETVPELIAYAKANPGSISYGSAGIGTSVHVCAELFKQMTGVDMVHVPYRGMPGVLTDLLSGRIQVAFDNRLQLDRTHQGWPTAGIGGHNRNTLAWLA